jgi:YD repeat-containing protein
MTITVEYLNSLQACTDGIKFCIKYKIIGFPLSRLPEIQGDHDYINWLKIKIALADKNTDIVHDYTYDVNNNIIGYMNSFEYWYERQYDSNNNMIKHIDSNGYVFWYEYDQNNNVTFYEDNNGESFCNTYDNDNNLVYQSFSDGNEQRYEYEFYNDGQLKRINDCYIPFFEKTN